MEFINIEVNNVDTEASNNELSHGVDGVLDILIVIRWDS